MPFRYATKELSINNAKAFFDSVNAEDSQQEKKSTILYATIGRTNEWETEPNPEYPHDSDKYLRYDLKRFSYAGKRIKPENISHVTDRHDWVGGVVFSMYRDTDVDMYERNWYVLTDEYNVYACLYNNKGTPSTIKPTGFLTIPFSTSDGYVWKYLYTISLGDAQKFLTTKYIPVKNLKVSDGTQEQERQVAVQLSAANGSIEIVELNSSGAGYLGISNGSIVSATTTSLRIADNIGEQPLTTDNIYNGSSVYIISGTGAGQLRRIVDYDGSSKTLYANTPFTVVANTDSKIIVSPTILVHGDGYGTKAYSRVNNGAVTDITVIDRGSDFTEAKVYISANSVHGSGATANAIVSPIGGHGSDLIRELAADKLMLNVKFRDIEGNSGNGRGYIPLNTEFRTISILKDPVLKVNSNNFVTATENIANTSNCPENLRLTYKLQITYNSMNSGLNLPVTPINVNDVITNKRIYDLAFDGNLPFITEMNKLQVQQNALKYAVRCANAHVVFSERDQTSSDFSFYNLFINNVQGYGNYQSFKVDDNILISSGTDEIALITDIDGPEANTFSGEILYTENIRPVLRTDKQSENLHIVLDF